MYVFVPMIKLSIDLRATSIFIRTLIHLMTYMQWFELCGEQKLQQCCVNWFLQLAWGQLHWSILAMRQTLNTEIYELRPPPFLHRPKISSDVHNAVWLCKNKTSGFPDVPFCVSTCICRWSPEYLFNSGPWHLYAFTNTRLMKCVNKWSFVGSPVPWHFSLNEKKSTMNHSQKQSINPVYSSSSGWKMVSKTEHCPITTEHKAWGGEKSGSPTFSVVWHEMLCLLWMCDAWIQKHSLLKYCCLVCIFSVKKHKHGCQTCHSRFTDKWALSTTKTLRIYSEDWHLGTCAYFILTKTKTVKCFMSLCLLTKMIPRSDGLFYVHPSLVHSLAKAKFLSLYILILIPFKWVTFCL